MSRQKTMKEKVRKLLAQAADQEGTPEAALFYSKAFSLMARYGFDERDLGSGAADGGLRELNVVLRGSYTDMQMNLLNILADCLHCVAVAVRRPRAVGVESGTVFGLGVHIDRVEMLFSLLNPAMAGRAYDAGATVSERRSYMAGFAAEIGRRLRIAEADMGEQRPGYGLALIDDRERARSFMEESVGRVSSHRRRGRLDARAYTRGASDARSADLGQSRVAQVKSLPRVG